MLFFLVVFFQVISAATAERTMIAGALSLTSGATLGHVRVHKRASIGDVSIHPSSEADRANGSAVAFSLNCAGLTAPYSKTQ